MLGHALSQNQPIHHILSSFADTFSLASTKSKPVFRIHKNENNCLK